MVETDAEARVKERISSVCSELSIPQSTETTATMLFDQTHDQLEFEGRRADPIGASALTIACRQNSLPITITDVTKAWNNVGNDSFSEFDTSEVYSQLDTIKDATGVGAPPSQPQDLTERYAEELDLPDEIGAAAHQLLQETMEVDPSIVAGGTSPSGIAAAAIYLAARIHGRRMEFTQQDIAQTADVTEVTIRNRYQDIAEALGGEEELKASFRLANEDTPDSGSTVESVSSTAQRRSGESETAAQTRDESSALEGDDRQTSEVHSTDDDSEQTSETREFSAVTAFAMLQRARSESESSATEIVDTAVRTSLKNLLDGGAYPTAPTRTDSVELPVALNTRTDRLLQSELASASCPFDSPDRFIDAAVASYLDISTDDANDEVTVTLPAFVVEAAERYLETTDEADSIDGLLRRQLLSDIEDFRDVEGSS